MSTIRFGTAQIKNPTPSGINTGVRAFTIVAGILLGWIQNDNTLDFLKDNKNMISSILGLVLAIINGIAPLFGVNTSQQVIPKEDVAAMKT